MFETPSCESIYVKGRPSADHRIVSRDPKQQERVLALLNSLVIFPPDDTASTLDPGNRSTFNFPQFAHGSIKLTVLFNNPNDPE